MKAPKIKFAIPLTQALRPVPDNISIVKDWGNTSIKTNTGGIVNGDHCIIEGTEDAIRDWLGKEDGFWKGIGSPQIQRFEVVHIKPKSDEG